MGEEIKPTSFKLGERGLQQLDELQVALQPFTENRSHTLRVALEILHDAVFTRGKLTGVLERLQGLIRTTSYSQLPIEFPAQIAAPSVGPKPLTRVSPLQGKRDARGREVRGVSRRTAVSVVDRALFFPLFLGKVRPVKSNSFRQVA